MKNSRRTGVFISKKGDDDNNKTNRTAEQFACGGVYDANSIVIPDSTHIRV